MLIFHSLINGLNLTPSKFINLRLLFFSNSINFLGSTNTDYDVVWKIVVPIKFLNQLPPAYFLTDSYRVTTNMSKYQ